MKISQKPRHWIALAIALGTMIVAIIPFVDFSGEPVPRWRDAVMMAGPVLTVAMISLNLVLDRRASNPRD